MNGTSCLGPRCFLTPDILSLMSKRDFLREGGQVADS